MTDLDRCDAEIAHCEQQAFGQREGWGLLQGWADWKIERQLIEEERNEQDRVD